MWVLRGSRFRGIGRTASAAAILLFWLSTPARAQGPDDFFNDEVLHDIYLTIHPTNWNQLKATYQLNDYYPCNFRWQGLEIEGVGIRSRGTGSRSGTKPGLRVDFDHYEPGQRFLGLKSVVLRNNVQDPSMLHERLSMQFFRQMGVQASREAHARLWVNDEYAGLYTIVENVDKRFLASRFGEDNGHLYKYDYPADALPWHFEWKGDDPDLYFPLPFKPETHERDPKPKPLVDMVQTINFTPDPDWVPAASKYLDLLQFLTHVAIENFLAETDGFLGDYGINNFYFYRFEKTTLHHFIPWDKSHTFFGGVDYPIFRGAAENWLMNRAMAFPDLQRFYLETLWRCADLASTRVPVPPELSDDGATEREWLEHEIVREFYQVRDAAYADGFKHLSDEEFEHEVGRMRDFARRRSGFVRCEAIRLLDPSREAEFCTY